MNEFKSRVIFEKLKKYNVKKVFYERIYPSDANIFVFFIHREVILTITATVGLEEETDVSKTFKEISEEIIQDIEFVKEKIDNYIFVNKNESVKEIDLALELAYILDDQISTYDKIKNIYYDAGWEFGFGEMQEKIEEEIKKGLQPIDIFYKVLKERNHYPQDILIQAINEDWGNLNELNVQRSMC